MDDVIDRLAEDDIPWPEIEEAYEIEEMVYGPRCCNVIPCRNPEGCAR